MRLTYLTIPLFALVLAGCGDDDADTALPMDNEVPAEEAYGTPADPADLPMNDTPAPTNEPMPPAEDPMMPEGDSDTTTEPRGDGL